MTHKTDSMQHILVPTDFSRNAFHALHYATELFKNTKCTFFLLNVYSGEKGFKSNHIDRKDQRLSDKLKEASKAKLEYTRKRIKKLNNNSIHCYKLISEPNDLMHAVYSLIDEWGIDLMVLGNKGEKSSIPVLLGSTTITTLKCVKNCPVLTVPKGAKINIPREIAFATDFKKPFNTHMLGFVQSMAILCEAPIHILHIDEEERLNQLQRSNLESLLAYFEPLACTVDTIPNFVSKTKIIQLFLEKSGINMLCMANYEHGFLERMLREPVIEKMILKIDIPFFVISGSD